MRVVKYNLHILSERRGKTLAERRQLEFWFPIGIQNLAAELSDLLKENIGCNLISVKVEHGILYLTFQKITAPDKKRNIFVSQSKKVKDGIIIERDMFLDKSMKQFSCEKKSLKVLNILDLGSKWLGIFEHVPANNETSSQQQKRGH